MYKIHLNFLRISDLALTVFVIVPLALVLNGFDIAVCAILG